MMSMGKHNCLFHRVIDNTPLGITSLRHNLIKYNCHQTKPHEAELELRQNPIIYLHAKLHC